MNPGNCVGQSDSEPRVFPVTNAVIHEKLTYFTDMTTMRYNEEY